MARIGMMSSPSELYGGGGGGKKKKKEEKKSGLTIYSGGKEKTPTGLDNAFNMNDMGLTPEVLMQYAQDYNLPTTSNREFQAAQLQMLQSTPEGQAQLQRMYDKYGMPKAGRYDDDILGVRTQALINDPSVRRFRGETIPFEKTPRFGLPTFDMKREKPGYIGDPVYAPTPYSPNSGALVAFYNDKTQKVTPIRPEDYEKFAVPEYGRAFLSDNYKGLNMKMRTDLGGYYKGVSTGNPVMDALINRK
jgi:hypothetical protein